ncbi:MAG: ribosome maturation factor RimP [Myxococcota bacterium]|nr:ribosome maturation factor RimP [Myxococcota bacterium]
MPKSTHSSNLHGIDRAALERIVDPIVGGHGAEVVDMEFKTERGDWVLRIFVEKAGASDQHLSTRDAAVDLGLCANVSRDLSPALDVVDLVPHAYHLEVSSPGVERPLRGERDFIRFAGQKAKLKLREAVDGQRVIVGLLDGVVAGHVRVIEGVRVMEVPLPLVDSARLVFELGSRGKERRPHPAHAGVIGRDTPQRKH